MGIYESRMKYYFCTESHLDLGINNPLEMYIHPTYLTNKTDVNIYDGQAANF